MNKKNLHLVFGHTNKAVLSQSGFIDADIEDVILLSDSLSLGPLSCMDDKQRTEERRLWWANHVYGSLGEDNTDAIEEDNDRIKKLVADIPQYHAIYFWFGEDSNEKIAMAKVLHSLREVHIPIFKPDFNRVRVKNVRGQIINPTTLYLMNAEDVPAVAKHFYQLTAQQQTHWQSLWKQLLSGDADFRIFDKSDNIVSGDYRFFDTFLLEACTREPKNSALIVAQVLAVLWNAYGLTGICDLFLFHRLNQLGAEGTIEITERHEHPSRSHTIFSVRIC